MVQYLDVPYHSKRCMNEEHLHRNMYSTLNQSNNFTIEHPGTKCFGAERELN